MSQTFKFKDSATLRHLNIRKEGDDEKVLKVDLKVEAVTDMTVPDYLDTGLRHFLWSAAGGIVRNPLIKAIGFSGEISDCTAEVLGLHFAGVKVHKFSVEPLDSWRVVLTMTLTFEPTKTDIAILAEKYGEDIHIELLAQPSLLDAASPAGAMEKMVREDGATATLQTREGSVLIAFGEGADPLLDQARQLVVEHKRASISMIQRYLRIGYNRAARLLEALESAGAVSAMDASGQRTVTST